MTKTLSEVAPYRCLNLCQPVVMPFGTIAGGSGLWNFEFGSLEFSCDLILGAWYFNNFP